MSEPRSITITARDGYELSGLWIAPDEPRAGALISSGTGFPKQFYLKFAAFGAARGFGCLIYDFRGIGGSAPADLNAMALDYPDWGRLDMPGALAALDARLPDKPLVHAGHSVGGHFAGFMDNQARIARHAFINVGSGYWGKHHWSRRPRELFFWWIYGPYCLARFGHIPAGGLWGGAALPKRVFQTWRRWCANPVYFAGELTDRLRPHFFDAVTAPIRSYVYTDDPIATPDTARDMLDIYPNAPSELAVRAPADFGLKRIGHEGLFRSRNKSAWPEIWDWLEEGL